MSSNDRGGTIRSKYSAILSLCAVTIGAGFESARELEAQPSPGGPRPNIIEKALGILRIARTDTEDYPSP